MKRLYEISSELQELYQRWWEIEEELNHAEGVEIDVAEQLEAERARVEGDIQAWGNDLRVKVEGMAKLLRNIEQESAHWKAKAEPFLEEAIRYQRRAEICKKQAERLKEYMLVNLQQADVPEIEGDELRIKRQKNSQPSVEVEDEVMVPEQYWIPQEPRLDKREIVRRWKAGDLIPGTRVVQSEHIRIR